VCPLAFALALVPFNTAASGVASASSAASMERSSSGFGLLQHVVIFFVKRVPKYATLAIRPMT
jgi:hypothetical protein